MSLRISNSNAFFRGQFSFNKIATQLLGTGVIMRIAGLNEESASFTYTAIDNTSATTPNINTGSTPYYIVTLSGSLQDTLVSQSVAPFVNTLAVTNTFITASITGSAFIEELITTPGAGNWTKPTGVTQVVVECWGGGGAGGGATNTDDAGAGGGAGAYVRKLIIYSSPQTTIPYSIASSTAGTTGNGATGGDTTWDTNAVIAKGGTGGSANDIVPQSGQGSTQAGSIGDVIYTRNDAQSAGPGRGGFQSGQGASTPGSTGNPNWLIEYGGAGGLTLAAIDGSQNGLPGNNYGAGGSGAIKVSGANRSGGNGAQGLIRLIYR